MPQAFAGLRVVEFGHVISAPVSAQVLALLGAEVVKVENPGDGDMMRRTFTDAELADRLQAPGFLTSNLGKRSIALDLKSEAGRAVAWKLVERADVVIENYRVGVMRRMGFGYDAVRARNPRVIYCSISGYGQEGPRAEEPAYDSAIQAVSGMMSHNGHPETGPTRTSFLAVDTSTGLIAALAVSSALVRRERFGVGQYLDVAMLDAALVLQSVAYANYTVRGDVPELFGNSSPARLPTSNSYETAHGHVLVAALTEAQQRAVFQVVGLAHLLDDPRFADTEARKAHRLEARAVLAEAFMAKTNREWVAELNAAGVPAQPVLTLPETIADPQLQHRGIRVRATDVAGFDAPLELLGVPFNADQDPPTRDAAPPATVGADSDAVLADLGYGADEVAALRAAGALG
ncbi:MAG: CoA transferase [Hyphomicrobiales bacterium]|nr:CoA transferase [Hyphomicrobiales bacterium]